jgi:ferric-dicitrate binding protein FerR (iron transport regulator)
MRHIISAIGLVLILSCVSCSEQRVSTGDSFEMVELPDGSVVFLNANSSISFDEDFSTRSVRAEGEVFLVVENNSSPFMVTTSLGDIEVTGTEFGVSTREESLEVEVEEGSVIVRTDGIERALVEGERAVVAFSEALVAEGKAEFKSRKWMKELRKEFKRMGKDIGRDSKKAAKSLKKELDNLK